MITKNVTRKEEGGHNNDSAVEEIEIETLSTPEVEEGEGGLGISEKENGKGLMEKQMPSKSVEETPSIGGESELEKSAKSRRVLRGNAEKANNASKRKVEVEERFPSKKRRLASQGKLKEGDRLKVTSFFIFINKFEGGPLYIY